MDKAPPQSYSVRSKTFDPAIGRQLAVSLDGKEIDQVISYDCGLGQILRYQTDSDGQMMLNEAKDEVLTEVLEGQVTVAWQ